MSDENGIFQPLEILEKRPNPIPFEKIKININNEEKEEMEETKNENVEEEIEKIDEIKENEPLQVKIVDHRRKRLIDRNAILNRIKSNFEVNVVDKVNREKEVAVMKPVRKIEIEEPEPELELEKEMEEAEPESKQEAEPEAELEKEIEEKKEEEKTMPIINKTGKRIRIKRVEKEEAVDVNLNEAVIRTQKVIDRLPGEREKIIVKAPSYYMNNRKIFIQKLTELFTPHKKEILNIQDKVSCDNRSTSDVFNLLTHQKIVRDYLNLYTPYRGLLLYHGLGSGKTCSSIAIAEGMKSNKKVFVLTPASLKMNFFSEIKKCGDEIYKKNQYWEFISIEGTDYVNVLSKALSLSTKYIKEKRGAWLVNVNKESNYESLNSEDKESLDEQLNEMIRNKYTDINYNGMNESKMKVLTGNGSKNPFDNAVLIIDEAHNFVSRIVNKVKGNDKKSISYRLYNYIMSATNAKVVLLTGTPIINYPNEIGILYNLLRGFINSWTIPLKWENKGKLNMDTILKWFDEENLKTYDSMEYSDNKLTITRNPFGFINTKKRGVAKGTKRIQQDKQNKTKKNKVQEGGAGEVFEKYNGVKLDDSGNITDKDFIEKVISILKKKGVSVMEGQVKQTSHKALPDNAKEFLGTFIDEDGNMKNINVFKRRILGLTSYFRSAQEELLPRYILNDEGNNYHIEKTEMTDHQFGIYEKIRKLELDKEERLRKMRMQQQNKVNEELFTIKSTYKIFSRTACNFTFPAGIERPIPTMREGEETTEEVVDVVPENTIGIDMEEKEETEEKNISENEEANYSRRIEAALKALDANKEGTNMKEYLNKEDLYTYSPKFAKVLENLNNPENDGLHLIYSHFRTMEGIGILRMILLANGYAEFKIKRNENSWELIEKEEEKGKPKFVLYTGTETAEEKEIIRNVYNSMWEYVPTSITNRLKEIGENNNFGDIIKVLMITSSGAEGINLRNTRFVHIVEPYWHMVRPEQVIGRARRICSHQDLPEELRTIKVYLYLSVLTKKQKTDDKHITLNLRDGGFTTDEMIYYAAVRKQNINNQLLMAVKESAVDCNLYSGTSKKDEEAMVCYGFGKVESNQYSSYPSFERDLQDKGGLDVKKVRWEGIEIKENNETYVLNPNTNDVYYYDSYKNALELGTELLLYGKLVKVKGKARIEKVKN